MNVLIVAYSKDESLPLHKALREKGHGATQVWTTSDLRGVTQYLKAGSNNHTTHAIVVLQDAFLQLDGCIGGLKKALGYDGVILLVSLLEGKLKRDEVLRWEVDEWLLTLGLAEPCSVIMETLSDLIEKKNGVAVVKQPIEIPHHPDDVFLINKLNLKIARLKIEIKQLREKNEAFRKKEASKAQPLKKNLENRASYDFFGHQIKLSLGEIIVLDTLMENLRKKPENPDWIPFFLLGEIAKINEGVLLFKLKSLERCIRTCPPVIAACFEYRIPGEYRVVAPKQQIVQQIV